MESSFFIRVYCSYYASSEDRIDDLIPTLSYWVQLIETYKNALGVMLEDRDILEFVLLQMLKIADFLNLSDETGRQKLLILQRNFGSHRRLFNKH
jgi:hypothetical protein